MLCDWCCLWLEDLGPFKPRCSSIEAAATCTHGKGTEQGEASLKQANDVQVYLDKDGPLPLYRGRETSRDDEDLSQLSQRGPWRLHFITP